jgi:hypothetical protein
MVWRFSSYRDASDKRAPAYLFISASNLVDAKTSFGLCLTLLDFCCFRRYRVARSEAWVWAKASSGPGFALLDFA